MRITSNIDKLQQGGGIPPFVSYTNVPRPQPTAPYSTSDAKQATGGESEGGFGLLDKNMVKMLYEKGLPSDVEQFLDQSGLFSESIMSNPFEKTNGAAQYKALLKILPKIAMNKEEYNRAIQEATKNNALKETAIDTDGRVFAISPDGQVTKKFISQLEEGEQTLTVGQMAENRVYSQGLAFNSNAITAIANSTSIEQINKTIWEVIKNLSSNTRANEYFRSKDERKAKAGIDKLLEEGADGVYKINSKSISQDTQAKYALNYILSTLPANQKVLLQDYARKSGLDLKTGPLEIITSMIQSGISSTEELEVNYDKQATNGANTDEKGNKKTRAFDIPMMIITGDGLPKENARISFGSNYAIDVQAQKLPFIPGSDGKPIGPTSLMGALSGQLGSVVNKDAVHVGKQRLDATKLNQLYYDGTGVSTMELPYTLDENGQAVPDFDVIGAYKAAVDEINKRGKDVTKAEVNQVFQERGLNRYFNEDGSFNRDNFMRFAGISVIGDDETFEDPDDNSDFFMPITDDRLTAQISATLGTKSNPMDMGDLYRTIAYVPIYDSPSLAGAASGNFSWIKDEGAMMEIAKEQQLRNARQAYNNNITKSQLLNGQ